METEENVEAARNDNNSLSCLLNPLDIPYVLETVLDYVTVWNLLKCRLVCKNWCFESNKILVKKCKIGFHKEDQLLSICSHYVQTQKLHLPFSILSQSFDFDQDINLGCDKIVRNFFCDRLIASHVKSLDLSYHFETLCGDWVKQVFPSLISLEELCLNGRSAFLYEEQQHTSPYPEYFKQLKFLFLYDSNYVPSEAVSSVYLRANEWQSSLWMRNVHDLLLLPARNLERVFFAPFMEQRAHTFFQMITTSPELCLSLTHLHINHLTITSGEINILVGKNFPLLYLHLVLSLRVTRDEVNYLLSSLSTLRELTITFTEGVRTDQFHPLVGMDRLTKLSLVGYEGPLVTSTTTNLQLFVTSLPNEGEGTLGIRINGNIKELEIYDSKQKYTTSVLSPMFIHFNTLSSLKMNNIDNTLLRLIYSHLPMLKELRICFHKFFGVGNTPIDVGLCGIPEYRLEECLLDCRDPRDLAHLRSYKWIGGMTHLRLLELELGKITDFGMILGISSCPSLKRLVMKNCDKLMDEDNESETMTDLSLHAICDLTTTNGLTYVKLDGYKDYFSEEAVTQFQRNTEGIETYLD